MINRLSRLANLRLLLKFRVSILGLVFTVLGVYLGGKIDELRELSHVVPLFAVPLIVLFAFVINDIVDADLDKFAKPHRAIPSGKVSKREAWVLAGVLAFSGLIIAWTTSFPLGIFAIFNIAMSIGYSLWLKQTLLLGNMTTSYLNASVIIYGALSVQSLNPVVIWATSLVFLYSLAYEVLYAVEDLEGDSQGGVMTTAHYLGQERSLWLIRLLCLIVITVALVPVWLGLSSPVFLVTIGILCISPMLWVIYKLKPSADDDTIRQSRTVMTVIQYLSAIPILLLHLGL